MTIETSAALGTVTQLLGGRPVRQRQARHRPLPRLQLVGAGRDRARRLGRVHLEQGARPRPGGGVEVRLLPVQHAEPGHLGRRHRLHPGAQVLGPDGDRPAPVGDRPGLQGGLQRDQQRGELAGDVGLGHRALRRRAHRRPQRRDLHVHRGRVAGQRGEGRADERRTAPSRATTAGSGPRRSARTAAPSPTGPRRERHGAERREDLFPADIASAPLLKRAESHKARRKSRSRRRLR